MPEKQKRRLNKKFRFQLLQEWLTSTYKPARVLDVGGGKGLLSFMLIKNGWQATVVDPVDEDVYLTKYKDFKTDKRVLLSKEDVASIPRIKDIFRKEMVNDFDLILGLHAHGSNMLIMQACQEHGKDFLLLPCCVIDEPLVKMPNRDWLHSLIKYGESLGFEVKEATLNFKGQNTLIHTDKYLEKLV